MEKMAHFLSFKAPKMGWLKLLSGNFLIVAILAVASFLRLYRISDYMTFLGDEGRDVLTAKGILEGNFTLLGPRASAGDFFTGPIYYYLIAPFLWLFKLDPVGPAVLIALIGIATVFLIYKVAKEFFNEKAAIFAAALYAVSPLVVSYSRSSWNPNPMPFVSLLTLYLTYKAVFNPSFKKYLLIGLLLGIAMQLHYISTFLAIIVSLFILLGNIYKKTNFKTILIPYGEIMIGFLIGFSPFLAFEARHGFPNTRTIFNFIFGNLSSTPPYMGNMPFIEIVKDVFFRLFGRLVTRFPPVEQLETIDPRTVLSWQVLTMLLAVLSLVFLFRMKNKLARILLLNWLFFGIFLFGFYKKPIHDHYFGFMFPLSFLLVGNFLSEFYISKIKLLKPASAIIFIVLLGFNLYGLPFRYEPNRQKDQAKKISEFVLSKTDDKPFNFALITPGNSDYAYRFYFEVLGKAPVRIDNPANDPQKKTVTNQLLIVCEDTACKPLGHPLFEVSNFGRAEIVGEWNVSVVKVYKLVHYKQ